MWKQTVELFPQLSGKVNHIIMLFILIRIYHECEGTVEKSVPRIAVQHHEACRVMTNGDPEGRMSTSVLEALPGKLDIKRHSPSILYILAVCTFFDSAATC